jgi:hypothetical protein
MSKQTVTFENLTPEEMRTLVQLGRKALRADNETRRQLQSLKINVVPANFYSAIPTVDEFEKSFEFNFPGGPYNSSRIFDPDAMREFLAVLDPYADEFDPPTEGDRESPTGYFWGNPAFSYSDAMAYYSMLRHVKPKHVLEVGSGFSTLVALAALSKNGSGSISCIEPFPMPWLEKFTPKVMLHKNRAQVFEADFFNEQLEDGDVFFIDSTHTVKAGSDCLHLYLRILPKLRADLMVHAHDIYLPFPMPRSDFERHIYWTEQYLLYAYLLDNPRVKVLYGSRYHARFEKIALEAFMRGRWPAGGASFWFSLRGRPD